MPASEPVWGPDQDETVQSSLPQLEPPQLIHLNSAGCSIPATPMLRTVLQFLQQEATTGGYETFDAQAEALQRPYTALAALLNCDADEIAILCSATEAWQQVLYGLAWTWKAGDRVLTSVAEYGSNYIALLQLARRTGVQIEVIPETEDGDIDLSALQSMLDGSKPPVLVSISHVPTSSGRVYDAAGVGALCRRAGVLYMLDACQSVGQMPVDVQHIGCDFLSGTGRKYLRGPRGSGFLFCRRDALSKLEPAHLDNIGASWSSRDEYVLNPTAKRFESYEMSFAAKAGLGVAVQECLRLGIASIWDRIQQLANLLRSGLQELPGVSVHDHGRLLCGLVSFSKAGLTADQVQRALHSQHINVAVSRIGSSRIDFEKRGVTEVVRASVHCYNTEQQLQRFLDAVRDLQPAPMSGT